MSEPSATMIAPQPDALLSMLPTPSPALTILKEATANGGNSFKLSHEPMACPPLPPAPDLVRAGKRAHKIATLTDLAKYVDHLKIGEIDPIAFYTDQGVSCVLNEQSATEKEVIECTLQRHPDFNVWKGLLGQKMSQATILAMLRTCNPDVFTSEGGAEYLIGQYASLTGTLVHGADDYLNMQGESATFTVKRKQRGQAQPVDAQVDDVPTAFDIAIKILLDDAEPTPFKVLVRMTGEAGAAIVFTLAIEGLEIKVADHLDARLQEFSTEAGFLCVRGEYQEEDWSEPQLPASVLALMKAQTDMLTALKKTV